MNFKITFSGIIARFVCILYISMLVNFSLLSQTVEPAKIVPPSPNAASLGKFADIPVGYYTGTPQVNIPLFEITEGEVKLPISLDYHAGGIRVEETASAVGLGWALGPEVFQRRAFQFRFGVSR